MKALTSAAGTLHSNCDFLVKNFQTRQTAMDDEIGGLIEAKAVMQGITGAANSESWVLFRTGDVKVDRVDGHTRKSIETICRHRKPGLWERMRLRSLQNKGSLVVGRCLIAEADRNCKIIDPTMHRWINGEPCRNIIVIIPKLLCTTLDTTCFAFGSN